MVFQCVISLDFASPQITSPEKLSVFGSLDGQRHVMQSLVRNW